MAYHWMCVLEWLGLKKTDSANFGQQCFQVLILIDTVLIWATWHLLHQDLNLDKTCAQTFVQS